MEIISRDELIQLYNDISPDIIFIPEHDLPAGKSLEYFILIDPLRYDRNIFWEWNSTSLRGWVRCIASGRDAEVWGFTDERDINFFLLRWT